jgi:hypothetical protein
MIAPWFSLLLDPRHQLLLAVEGEEVPELLGERTVKRERLENDNGE